MDKSASQAESGSIPDRLQEIARLLREADHLGPEAQQALADLLGELSLSLKPGAIAAGHAAQLRAEAEELGRALHERHDSGLLGAAKQRMREAAARAESEAPIAAGVARRFLDALANMGI